ncbi:hypothetical protein FRB93_013022 [Tulasnella sp. JGI-2019a]|nr:hypothetical protein FRB93_013022 [Tulasnella sp. JGI-2019a]
MLLRARLQANCLAKCSISRSWTSGFTTARHVHASAIQLAYEEIPASTNPGPSSGSHAAGPLVICHGLFGSKQNWRSLCKAFSKTLGRSVYALDLRNHGVSPHHEVMDYESMAADVLHFCETYSLKDISLLGHSMGGKVVAAVALSPSLPSDLLSRLILVDMSPAKGPISAEFQSYVVGMKEIESRKTKSRKEADEVLQEYEKDLSVRQFLLTNLTPASPSAPQNFRIPLDYLEQGIKGLGDFPYEPGERTWDGKTLIVKGAKSKYVNRRNIPIAQQYFPNMKLETLEAGHWGESNGSYMHAPRIHAY